MKNLPIVVSRTGTLNSRFIRYLWSNIHETVLFLILEKKKLFCPLWGLLVGKQSEGEPEGRKGG